MSVTVEALLLDAFRGRSCRAIRRDFDWAFDFEGDRSLTTTSPWRVVTDDLIAFASSDDGHKFGNVTPIDGERRTNVILAWRTIRAISLDATTSDLTLIFDGPRIDIFNGSSGYEAWQATWTSGGDSKYVVGLGGGGLSTNV